MKLSSFQTISVIWFLGLLGGVPALLVGSVHTNTQIVFIFLGIFSYYIGGLIATGSSNRKHISIPYVVFFSLFVLAIMLIQSVPLPPFIIKLLSPHKFDLLQRLEIEHNFSSLSYSSPETVFNIAKLYSYSGFAFLAYQLTKKYGHARNILYITSYFGVVLAITALLHPLLGLKTLFGVYKPQQSNSFFAPFVNPNNAAGYYSFILFILFGLALDTERPRIKYFLLFSSLIVFLAVIFSGSRAIIGFLPFGFTFLYFSFKKQEIKVKLSAKFFILISIILISIPLMDKYVSPFLGSTPINDDVKILLWKDTIPLIKDHSWFGIGKGAFQIVFPHYMTVNKHIIPYNPENILIEQFVDFGIPFALFIIGVPIYFFIFYVRNIKLKIWQIGLMTAIFMLLIQNLFDFNLYFPGTAIPLFIGLGILEAYMRNSRYKIKRHKRINLKIFWVFHLITSVLLLFFVFSFAKPNLLENQRKILKNQKDPQKMAQLAKKFQYTHPSDSYISTARAYAEIFVPQGRPLKWAGLSSYLFPINYYPELMAGRILLKLGKLSQAKLQYQRAFAKNAPIKWKLIKETMLIWKKNSEYLTIYPLQKIPQVINYLPSKERIKACEYIINRNLKTPKCVSFLMKNAFKFSQWSDVERYALIGLTLSDFNLNLLSNSLLLRSYWEQKKYVQFSQKLSLLSTKNLASGVFYATYGIYLAKDKNLKSGIDFLVKYFTHSSISLSTKWYLSNAIVFISKYDKNLSSKVINYKMLILKLKRLKYSPKHKSLFKILFPIWKSIFTEFKTNKQSIQNKNVK